MSEATYTNIGLAEAKNKLSQLLDRVERGEEVTITRHDEAVARLVSVKRPSLNDAKKTIEAMRALRAANPVAVTSEEIGSWKNSGRP